MPTRKSNTSVELLQSLAHLVSQQGGEVKGDISVAAVRMQMVDEILLHLQALYDQLLNAECATDTAEERESFRRFQAQTKAQLKRRALHAIDKQGFFKGVTPSCQQWRTDTEKELIGFEATCKQEIQPQIGPQEAIRTQINDLRKLLFTYLGYTDA